MTKQFAKHLS